MIDQENPAPLDRQGGEEAPEAKNTGNETDSSDIENLEDKSSELGRLQQATEASEPAFTLHPEKGVPPGPENYNSDDEQEEHNLKQ